jgi:hypothetical protein
MKSEPVRVSKLMSPLKTAMPAKAERHEASALPNSDLAVPVPEGLAVDAALVTSDRSAGEVLNTALPQKRSGRTKTVVWSTGQERYSYRSKMTVVQQEPDE